MSDVCAKRITLKVESTRNRFESQSVGRGGPARARRRSQSRWGNRFLRAARRYDGLGVLDEGLPLAIAKGLREWSRLVPQVDQTSYGGHLPANTWGLGPELKALRLLIAELTVQGKAQLADRMDVLVRDLEETTRFLDDCYPKVIPEHDASEQRLACLARSQSRQLANLLDHLGARSAAVRPSPTVPAGGPTPQISTPPASPKTRPPHGNAAAGPPRLKPCAASWPFTSRKRRIMPTA